MVTELLTPLLIYPQLGLSVVYNFNMKTCSACGLPAPESSRLVKTSNSSNIRQTLSKVILM